MRRTGLVAAALLIALGGVAVAQAEVEQKGDLIVAFDGGISPRALPRTALAPVTVKIDSSFRSSEGIDPPPQLQTISIGINRAGKIFDRGLPTCKVRKIQPATIAAARKLCRDAIVGSGRVQVRVHLTNQQPFTFRGPLLVFHAKRAGGHRRLLAQVYGLKPPSAFVLNFRIVKEPGVFGTVIKTTLPETAHKWAYVTHFEMKLRRVYTYNGRERSFISARCAAPKGFPGAVYPFAEANFGFGGGEQVSTTLIRDCKVAK
jgi:hypothetical protein